MGLIEKLKSFNKRKHVCYKLGKGRNITETKCFWVDYDSTDQQKPIMLYEGKVIEGKEIPDVGNWYSIEEIFNNQHWIKHIKIAGCEWLIPIIKREISGDKYSTKKILDEFKKVHGHSPEKYTFIG